MTTIKNEDGPKFILNEKYTSKQACLGEIKIGVATNSDKKAGNVT